MNTVSTLTFISGSRLPVTRVCKHSCGYCGYHSSLEETLLTFPELDHRLEILHQAGVSEVTLISGESPQEYPGIQVALAARGCHSFTDYLEKACQRVLHYGFLPVLEVGRLASHETKHLAQCAGSLLIEVVASALQGPDEAHQNARGRDPHGARVAIEEAHNAGLPYHLNFLFGIGETATERRDLIGSLGRYCVADPLLQDIRITPFQPQPGTPMQARPPLPFEQIAQAVVLLREAFPVHPLSVAPHLFSRFPELAHYGMNDLGSISLTGGDPVAPTFPVPSLEQVKQRLLADNHFTGERLPLSTPIALNRPHIAAALAAVKTRITRRASLSLALIDDRQCFVCGKENPVGLKLSFTFGDGPSCTTSWIATPRHQGYAGIVHGGILSTLLDEVMAQALISAGHPVVTVDMKVTFRKPAPLGIPLTITGKRTGGKGRLHFAASEVQTPDGSVLALAEGRYSTV